MSETERPEARVRELEAEVERLWSAVVQPWPAGGVWCLGCMGWGPSRERHPHPRCAFMVALDPTWTRREPVQMCAACGHVSHDGTCGAQQNMPVIVASHMKNLICRCDAIPHH